MLAALGEPQGAQAVLEQPIHHVALGEHLGLAGDLVGLDLAAGMELGVQGLALRVVPVLVDPAQGHVVGPAGGQHRCVQCLDHQAQGGGTYRDQVRHVGRPIEAGQFQCQILEDQL
ncbi:hypothetical protein [uncultured Lamprocystis sp.]|uniref:hypothetical protein n=1 Tax=uncultured Lamprocystis sp. TaxID=543132 RepID=UPI0025F2E0C1|nr:hypothetical protein [uncultured Lamprocystis sp.]